MTRTRALTTAVLAASALAGAATASAQPAGTTHFQDAVHGPISFENEHIESFVILRSDTHPTYHLSVVADDVAMRISHVVRGDDHISNTPKHVLLYEAVGAAVPQFAHVPLILGADKKRKRGPCHATYHYVFQAISAADLTAALGVLVNVEGGLGHVAMDGKRLRGSQHETSPGVHMLHAFSSKLQAAVGSLVVPPDSGECIEACDYGVNPRFLLTMARLALAVVSFVCLGLGYWWILVDPQRRAWHDRLTGTRVVVVPKA